MTSLKYSADKKAASYDLRRAFKQALIPAVFSFLMSAIVFIGSAWESLAVIKDELNGAPAGFLAVRLAPEWAGCSVLCVFIGVLFALTNFYIMTKPSVNFHLALSVDRKTLFKNRFIASAVLIAAVFGAVFFIDYLINAAVLGNAGFIFRLSLSLWFEAFIYAMAGYAIISVAVFSCYTVVEGLFFGAALLVLPTVVLSAVEAMFYSLLNGYSAEYGVFGMLIDGAIYSSPYMSTSLFGLFTVANPLFLGFVNSGADGIKNIFSFGYQGYVSVTDGDYSLNYNYMESAELPDASYYVPLVIWIAIIALLAKLAMKIFVNRKAERTSIHASNPIASHLFAAEVGIAALFAVIVYAEDITSITSSRAVIAVLCAAVFGIAYIITLAINKRQLILKNRKSYLVPAAGTALVLAFGFILIGGGFGYTAYAPKAETIEYATVTNASVSNITGSAATHKKYETYPTEGYMYNCLAVFEGTDDIKALLAQKDEIVKDYKKKNSKDAERVVFVYVTQTGKRVVREYYTSEKTAVASALALMNTPSYKDTVSDIINGEDQTPFTDKIKALGFEISDYITADIFSSEEFNNYINNVYNKGTLTVEHFGSAEKKITENTPELRKALADDLAAADSLSLLTCKDKELCRLVFSTEEAENGSPQDDSLYMLDDSINDNGYINQTYIVYPFMKNTVSYLTGKGLIKDVPYFNSVPYEAYYSDAESYNYLSNYECISVLTGYDCEEETYYDEINGGYTENNFEYIANRFEKHTNDKAEIEKLMKAAKPYGLLNDSDYVVAFKMKTPEGKAFYRFMCIPKEKMN